MTRPAAIFRAPAAALPKLLERAGSGSALVDPIAFDDLQGEHGSRRGERHERRDGAVLQRLDVGDLAHLLHHVALLIIVDAINNGSKNPFTALARQCICPRRLAKGYLAPSLQGQLCLQVHKTICSSIR